MEESNWGEPTSHHRMSSLELAQGRMYRLQGQGNRTVYLDRKGRFVTLQTDQQKHYKRVDRFKEAYMPFDERGHGN